jgi:hypothetical protein
MSLYASLVTTAWHDVTASVLLQNREAIFTLRGCQSQNIQMIALVFGFVEATPGVLFIMCVLTLQNCVNCGLQLLLVDLRLHGPVHVHMDM